MLGAVDACCETHGSKALILQFRQFTASQCTAITVERERERTRKIRVIGQGEFT